MKQRVYLVFLALLFTSCTGFFDLGNEEFNGSEKPSQTFVQFNNESNPYSVSVYGSHTRAESSKFADLGPNLKSPPVSMFPSSDGFPFYLTYYVLLDGYKAPYIPALDKGIIEVRIPRDQTTNVLISPLDQLVGVNEILFNDAAYLVIKHIGSGSGFRLVRGTSNIKPENSSSDLVNPGEGALYRLAPGIVSPLDVLAVSASNFGLNLVLSNIEPGYFYSLTFNGSSISLIRSCMITLGNI